jgi:hypothetical protein
LQATQVNDSGAVITKAAWVYGLYEKNQVFSADLTPALLRFLLRQNP